MSVSNSTPGRTCRRHRAAAGAVSAVRRSNRRSNRRGLSVVEVLISLAIAASLLTAVAMAYSAAAQGVQMNDQFFRATQAARVSVNQIMTECRRCQSGVVGTTDLQLTLNTGEKRVYAFDAVNHQLLVSMQSINPTPTVPIARNVQDVRFFTDGTTISMDVTVKIGNNQIVLNGSAMPRRAVTYK